VGLRPYSYRSFCRKPVYCIALDGLRYEAGESLFNVERTGNGAGLVGHLPFKQVLDEAKILEFDANGTRPPL
jgi:hypothetical protein